jgi:hypothetical protein
MNAMAPESTEWKLVGIRLRAHEKDKLRELLEAQGISSLSGYLRSLAVQQIRKAEEHQEVVANVAHS